MQICINLLWCHNVIELYMIDLYVNIYQQYQNYFLFIK